MLMDLYKSDRNSRKLIDEYTKNGSKGRLPEYANYPFISELDDLLEEKGDKLLTANRYTQTIKVDKILKALGTEAIPTVNIDGKKIDIVDVFEDYTIACLYEGFLNGYLALLNIISGKRI